jgi:hypothetical protein
MGVGETINADGSVTPEIGQEGEQPQSKLENKSKELEDFQFQKIIFLLLRKY